MDSVYECLVDERTILEEAKACLVPFIDDSANWNNNRYGYIYTLLYKQLDNPAIAPSLHINMWHDIAYNKFAHIGAIRDHCRSIYKDINTSAKAQCARGVFCIIIELLVAKRLIAPHDTPVPRYDINESIVQSALFKSLPRVVRFFVYIATKHKYEKFKSHLYEQEQNFLAECLQSTGAKERNWSSCASAYRRLVFHEGLSSFNEITSEIVIKYKTLQAERNSTLSFNTLLPLISYISGNDLSGIIGSSTSGNKPNSGSAEYPDDYYLFKTKKALQYCGLRNVIVKSKKTQGQPVVIGEWSFLKDQVSDYAPAMLNASRDSSWTQSQLEYIEHGKFEKGTQRHIIKTFSILNLYLFSYLPYFFSKHTPPYPYPDKPKDFHGFIYVSPSTLAIKHLYKAESLKLPVNLIDFAKAFMKTDAINGGANTIRDSVARLQLYLKWLNERFGSIDDFKLPCNPITDADKRSASGYSYQRSNKKKFDYEYWELFKEFLKAVSETLVTEAESAIESTKEVRISVNKDVSFGKTKLHIGAVDISYFPLVSLAGDSGAVIKVLPYQHYCALLLMASSGLRLSNVMWLDTRTFDQHYSTASEDDYGIAWVNTDKAKEEPFESSVPTDVMNLAIRVKALRPRVYNIAQTPFPYQENKTSKWGEILPLFQYNQTNHFLMIARQLADIIREFEFTLSQNKVEFETELMYAPRHIPPQDLLMLKRNKILINDKRFSVIWEEDGIQQEAYFTPIQFKTELTPHSLRKTFVSYMAVLCGNEATGKIFTGQTDATVGYYLENTPEEELQIKGELARLGIPSPIAEDVVKLNKIKKDEDAIIERLKKSGLAGINGFTLARIRKPSDDIDKAIATASPSDIAVNRTHICLYNNECPEHILDRLDRTRNCALCPEAIGSSHDGPAIAATIKYHCDRINDINSMLEGGKLNKREREKLIQERVDETMLACSWFIRLKHINNHLTGENTWVVLGDGASATNRRLKYVMPKSDTEATMARIQEVEGIEALQSNRLKKAAERMSRKLLKALNRGEVELPEADEVEVAVALIKKVATTQQLSNSQVAALIEAHDEKQQQSNIINVLELINEQ